MLLLSACTRVPFNVPPPPPVPDPVVAPMPPELRSEATDFEPEATSDAVGQARLRLKTETVGLAPIADQGFVTDLHDQLVVALLAGGFQRVIDLEPAQAVTASHLRTGRGEEIELSGAMDDLMSIAPVSRARLLITGEIVQASEQERRLPVRFWYDDADLAIYQGKVDDYLAARDLRQAEIEAARSAYAETFRQAEVAYAESRPWWQKLLDGVVEPKEAKAKDAYLDDLRQIAVSMASEPRASDSLGAAAAARDEARSVTIYVARLRLQVQQPDTGQVLAIVHAGAEGRTAQELVDNLTSVAQATLGDR